MTFSRNGWPCTRCHGSVCIVGNYHKCFPHKELSLGVPALKTLQPYSSVGLGQKRDL